MPTLQLTCPRVALARFPGVRGERLCSQGYVVASGDGEAAIMADGDVPDGHFSHCLGDTDGHLMPLSPAVRVRYDTMCKQLYQLPRFPIFTLTYVATCW